MTLVVEITPDLELQIRQAASSMGVAPDQYVLESVTARLSQTGSQRQLENLAPAEAHLIGQINHSFDAVPWEYYHALIEKRQAETLTDEEQARLIAISDQIEEANVERLTYLAALADLRHITLPDLMDLLEIKPITHG